MSDSAKWIKFFEKSTKSPHPIQSGNGRRSGVNRHLVVPVTHTPSSEISQNGGGGEIQLVSPVEAEIVRAKDDIKHDKAPPTISHHLAVKRTATNGPRKGYKRRKVTRDIFG